MFLKRLKGDKMKKNVSFMLCYLVFLSPIVGTEVMKSSEHATKPKGDMIISDEAWKKIVQGAKPPKKLKVKRIDQENDIIYLEKEKKEEKKEEKK